MASRPNDTNQRKKGSSLRWWIMFSIGMAIILVAVGLCLWCVGYQSLSTSAKTDNHLADLGNYGSYLQGTVASCWALAVGFLILVAFLVQNQQLQIQQEELEMTRADMERQAKRLEDQEQTSRRQNFESTFFQLLNLQNQTVSQMRQATVGGQVHEGRDCFSYWYSVFRREYQNRNPEGKSEDDKMRILKMQYGIFYGQNQGRLGHYFRTLYHLIKFVKLSDIVVENKAKRQYTSLVRAQLSAYELAFLFYNCLSPHGEKFKPWVEEFGLLEHVDKEILLEPFHAKLYEQRAYE